MTHDQARSTSDGDCSSSEATFQPDFELASKFADALQKPTVLEELGAPPASKSARYMTALVRGALGLVVLVSLIAITTSGAPIRPWQVFALTILSVFYGIVSVALSEARRSLRLAISFLDSDAPMTYSLEAAGVVVTVAGSRTFTPWHVVRRVMLLESFVLIARDDAVMYVPRSAFPDELTLHKFTSYASERIAEAQAAKLRAGSNAKGALSA